MLPSAGLFVGALPLAHEGEPRMLRDLLAVRLVLGRGGGVDMQFLGRAREPASEPTFPHRGPRGKGKG